MTPGAIAEREITIRRVFDAPRAVVWEAWTQPERLAAWWGKRGWSTPPDSVTMDVRPGGVFEVNSIEDATGAEMPTVGVYREVDAPRRLVFDSGPGTTGTVTLTELGDGRTEMVFHTALRTTEQTRRNAEAGMGSAFDRLAELVSQGRR